MELNRLAGAEAIEARLARTDDPRHQRMLTVLGDHIRAEATLDLDGLMATLVDEPRYHLWGSGRDTGPKGRDEVVTYYSNLVTSKRGVLEYDIERIVVDDATIVTEGFIRAFQPGDVARAFGYAVPDTSAHYLVRYRALVIWPFDEEGVKLLGEDGYAGIDPADFQPVDFAGLPDEYTSQFGDLASR
ncbi:MAG TPA: hypothetical protein VNQ73_07100 [Ilumatobacter sp.]|nr:hypothetical protein [Ilumatobacter sp.]